MSLSRLFAFLIVIIWAWVGIGHTQDLTVKVIFEGVDKDLRADIERFSSLVRNKPAFSSLAPLRRAAEGDAKELTRVLQSRGYYAARTRADVRREGRIVDVRFEVDLGPLFSITQYEIVYEDPQKTSRPQDFTDVGAAPDGSATGARLKELEDSVRRALWQQGYLAAESLGHEVRANFGEATGTTIFTFRSGPQATYAGIYVDGAVQTDPDFVRQLRPYEIGTIAKRSELEKYRENLVRTGLFSEIAVEPELPDEAGNTNIRVTVNERKHRTIGGGLSYAVDVGPGATAFWENRNFLRRGETLRADLAVSEPIQEISGSFRKFRPKLPGYYTFRTSLRNEDTDAFNAQTVEVGGALSKLWLDDNLTTQGGVTFQYSDIRSRDGETVDGDVELEVINDTFRAVSVPMSVVWNSQDNPLDPQKGFIASFQTTPFFANPAFTRFEVNSAARVFWGRDKGGTLAGRMQWGAIQGVGRADIPATERFYAGGGGSLRGYAFQEASPINDATGDVLGGASLAEFNLELRQHVTKSLELAAFVDAGGAFEANLPDFEEVLVGAGGGFRYHTPIGPVRIDVAFPLERRRFEIPASEGEESAGNVFQDSAWQFYIGLGQPF